MKKADDYDIDIQVCSATDCTGLIPALPQDEAELESYKALSHFQAKAQTRSETSRHKTEKAE